jgi:hypothetical protein
MTLAQVPLGNINGIGPLGDIPNANSAYYRLSLVISTVVGFVTIMAGLWFILQLLTGAFSWITSGGDKQALTNAQHKITHAIIGLFMVVASYAIISIIGLVFGFNIIGSIGLLQNIAP